MKTFYVWAWGSDGQRVLFTGTRKACADFRRDYNGYRKSDMFISER